MVPSPSLNPGSSVGDGQEPMRIRTLVAKATVKRPYECIVGRPFDKLRRALPGRLTYSVTPLSYAER